MSFVSPRKQSFLRRSRRKHWGSRGNTTHRFPRGQSLSAHCCWRALARQLPILYNSEEKAKSVGCKIEDMRSRLCFYIQAFRGACERTWKYWSISSNSPAQLQIKDTIEYMNVSNCFWKYSWSHEWFSDDYRGRQEIFMCLAALLWQLCEQFLPIREWRCQDIDPSPTSWDHIFAQCIQQQWSVSQNYFHSEWTGDCSLLVSGNSREETV